MHDERSVIWRIHIEKRLSGSEIRGDVAATEDFVNKLSDLTNGFTGAEIEQAMISALYDAFSERRNLEEKDILTAIANTVPLSITQKEELSAMRAWASTRAVSATAKSDREKEANKSSTQSGGRNIDF